MSDATDILMHRTIASARGEGTPQPLNVQVHSSRSQPGIYLQLRDAEDRQRWQDWFTGHGAEEWSSGVREVGEYQIDYVQAAWRGWLLELVHLTPAEPEAGGSR